MAATLPAATFAAYSHRTKKNPTHIQIPYSDCHTMQIWEVAFAQGFRVTSRLCSDPQTKIEMQFLNRTSSKKEKKNRRKKNPVS
jgi:hypothetical protein